MVRRSPPRDPENHGGKTANRVAESIGPSRRPAMPLVPICADGERCVCSPPYYFLASTYHLSRGRRLWLGGEPGTTSPHGADMNDFGRRAGGEALQFGPGGLGSVFSELGAVVAATVVLGLAFVILS